MNVGTPCTPPPPVRIWPIARESPPPPPPPQVYLPSAIYAMHPRAHIEGTLYKISGIRRTFAFQEIAAPDTQKVCFLDARALPMVGSARAHASCVCVCVCVGGGGNFMTGAAFNMNGGGGGGGGGGCRPPPPPKAMLDPPLTRGE